MRKILSILLLVVVLMLAVVPAALADGGTTKVVQSPWGLCLREKAGLGQPLVTVMHNGDVVTMLGKTTWKQGILWAKVEVTRYGTTYQGFCSNAYLVDYAGYPEPTDSWSGDNGWKVISGNGLRLRSGPGLGYGPVRVVPYGTILKATNADTVEADGYTWRQLKYGGNKVWGAQEFLQDVGLN